MIALLYIIGFSYILYTYPLDILMYVVSIYNYIHSLFEENYVVYYNIQHNAYSFHASDYWKDDYIFYFELLKHERYVCIKKTEDGTREIVPVINNLPCFTFEITVEDLGEGDRDVIDIYDTLVKYFIEGNVIDRNIIAFILLYDYQVNINQCPNITLEYVNDECEVVKMTWEESEQWKLEL